MAGRAALLVLCLTAAATAAAWAGPATAPGARGPQPPGPLVAAAVAAVDADDLGTFAATVETQVAEAMPALASAPPERLIALATFREFGWYFARARGMTDAQRAALRFLAEQPRLCPALMLAVGPADPPDRVLQVLAALHATEKDRLDDHADLAAAFCVVWDDPDRFGGEEARVDEARLQRLFRYYATGGDALRYAPRRLPPELLTFVVDNTVTEREIEWARAQYPRRVNVAAAFFDPVYDPGSNLNRAPEAADDPRAYNLPNLRRFGGGTADAAHYAAHVGKSFGVPTATFTALGGEGREAQHWVAYFELGDRPQWNLTDGRYRGHAGSVGTATDPQTMDDASAGDLAVLSELVGTKATARQASAALAKLSDAAERDDAVPMIVRAVELSPGNRRAWRQLAELAAGRDLSEDQRRELDAIVADRLDGGYPAFALAVRLKMAEREDLAERLQALDDVARRFRRRPALVAQVRMAQGAVLVERSDRAAALRAFGDAIDLASGEAPSVVAEAMAQVDALLREADDLRRLAEVYDGVWDRLPRPAPCPYARSTAYYMIGDAYATVLDELNERQRAAAVRMRLSTLFGSATRR